MARFRAPDLRIRSESSFSLPKTTLHRVRAFSPPRVSPPRASPSRASARRRQVPPPPALSPSVPTPASLLRPSQPSPLWSPSPWLPAPRATRTLASSTAAGGERRREVVSARRQTSGGLPSSLPTDGLPSQLPVTASPVLSDGLPLSCTTDKFYFDFAGV